MASWEWNNNGRYTPFDEETQGILEKAYTSRTSSIQLTHGWFGAQGGYQIDLGKMEQKKNASGYVRSIRRMLDGVESDPIKPKWELEDPKSGKWTPFSSMMTRVLEGSQSRPSFFWTVPEHGLCDFDFSKGKMTKRSDGTFLRIRRDPPSPSSTATAALETGKEDGGGSSATVMDNLPTPSMVETVRTLTNWTVVTDFSDVNVVECTTSSHPPSSEGGAGKDRRSRKKKASPFKSSKKTKSKEATKTKTSRWSKKRKENPPASSPPRDDAGQRGKERMVDECGDDDDASRREESFTCPICFDVLDPLDAKDEVVHLCKCRGHFFHRNCIAMNGKMNKFEPTHLTCPVCNVVYGTRTGNMPAGSMSVSLDKKRSLPGYDGDGMYTIRWSFPGGTQSEECPSPGRPFYGTSRTAYLPASEDGARVLKLFQIAYDRRLMFQVNISITDGGDEERVVWNGIHAKTSQTGGFSSHGYPDATYLERVTDELAQKGITVEDLETHDFDKPFKGRKKGCGWK